MFQSESTIQPINHVDADERLSPSDSLSFEDESLDYPGPSPDNFAKEAGFLDSLLERLPENEWDEDAIRDWVRRHDPHGPVAREDEEGLRHGGRHNFPDGDYVGKHRKEHQGLELPEKLNSAYDLYDFLYNASSAPIPGITANQHLATGRSVYDLLNEQAPGEPSGLGELLFQPDGGRHHDDVMYGEHSFPEITSPPAGYSGRHREFDPEDIGPMMMYTDPREQALYEQHLQKVNDFGRNLGDTSLHPYDPRFSDEMAPAPEEYIDPRQPRSFGRSASIEDFLEHEEPEEDDDLSIKHFSNYHFAAGVPEGLEALGDALGGAEKVEDFIKSKNPKQQVNEGLDPDKFEDKRGLIEEVADDFAGPQTKKEVGGYWPGRPDGQTVTSSLYDRPAGLSDKYIRVEAHVDHYSDPVQQFRDDPVGFIQKRGYMMSDSADIRLAEYIDLVDHDPGIRTAAWRDVRTKALRLRREGRVHVKDLGPNRIYANVEGDSDTYETMILKGAGNDQSISDWHCSCPWGRWAFKRQMSYVGRLCSHGYASYLEMESQQMKANNKRRKSAGVTAREFEQWCKENRVDPKDPKAQDYWSNAMLDNAIYDHMDSDELWDQATRTAGIVEDFKQWADNENDGMIDQQAIDNFIYLLNSQQDGDHTIVSEEDAEKLYDALDGMKSKGMVRDYDVDYLERPGDVYKDASFHEADVLHLRPQSLTPDYYFVEDGQDGESWTDVTKDERKTTGPDNMVRKSRRLVGRELHYASDEELGHAVKDWAGAGSKLEKLRNLSADDPEFQNMREKNDEIRRVIDELHDRGIDASQFVASLRFAADTEEDVAASDDEKKKGVPASQQGQPSMAGKPSSTGQPGGSSSIEKPDTSQAGGQSGSSSSSSSSDSSAGGNGTATSTAGPTNDLSGQKRGDPASVGFNSRPDTATNPASNVRRDEGMGSSGGSSSGGGVNIDPNAIINSIGQVAGGIANAIPSIMYSLPSMASGLSSGLGGLSSGLSGASSGLSSGISGLANGLSGILASNHVATPIGGFPNVQLTNQESFQGSGPNPKYWMGSSECYVDDHERGRFVDVTDLDDDPLVKFVKDKPQQGPKKSGSRRPFVASEDEVYNDLLQAKGDEIEAQGLYSQFIDDAEESGNPNAASVFEEALNDERDHEQNFDMMLDHYANSENANPDGSTLTSGSGMNDTGAVNLDQVFKAGAVPHKSKPWDGHRVRDFQRFVKQQGGTRPTYQHLQEYLSKPHRGLDQGGRQHLQDFTSYAEQHEASVRYAGDIVPAADMAVADVPGASNLMPDDPGMAGDRSDIVAQFHRMGGIEAINNSGGGGSYSDSAIAQQAQGFLRTAGRNYSLAEQRELENESHPKGARNLDELDLRGTHYEDAL